MKLCERCHKERDDADFAQFHDIGVFCSWCREHLQVIVDKYGIDGAKTWIFEPRTDLMGLIEGEGKRILDCGCWAGYTMQALKDEGHEVYGLDIEDNRRVCKDAVLWPMNLHSPTDYLGISETREVMYFDYILFGDVLEHLTDPLPALKAAKRWLTGGGRVLISVPNAGWIGSVLSIANQHFPRDESGHFDKTHLRFYTREQLGKTIKEAGFNRVEFFSKQLPDATPWPEGKEGEQLFQWDNVIIKCNRDLFEQLNTYQVLARAWVE